MPVFKLLPLPLSAVVLSMPLASFELLVLLSESLKLLGLLFESLELLILLSEDSAAAAVDSRPAPLGAEEDAERASLLAALRFSATRATACCHKNTAVSLMALATGWLASPSTLSTSSGGAVGGSACSELAAVAVMRASGAAWVSLEDCTGGGSGASSLELLKRLSRISRSPAPACRAVGGEQAC